MTKKDGAEKISFDEIGIQFVLAELFENFPDPIFYYNTEDIFLYVNKSFAKFHGLEQSDIIGRHVSDLFDKKQADIYIGEHDKVKKTQKALISENSIRDINNNTITSISQTDVVKNKKGEIIGVLGFARNITEFKKLEEHQKEQEIRLESMTYVANNFAHNFNNLLGSILGYTELLQQSELDPVKMSYLEKIILLINQGKSTTTKISNLTDQGKLEEKIIYINRLLKEITTELNVSKIYNIKSKFELAVNLYSFKGDEAKIHTLFSNIISNAFESMIEGGILEIKTSNVNITNHKKLIDGDYIKIEIHDEGRGITPDLLPDIFNPFVTDKKKSNIGYNIGLGLTTAKKIVTDHKGLIEVNSIVGKGSTFSIFLPKFEEETKIRKTKKGKVKKVIKKKLTQSKTILIIDDNIDLLEIMKINLSKEGFNILYSSNANEGIQLFKEHLIEISLVILDYLMPDKNGLEVFEELKEINPKIKVILVTGYTKDMLSMKEAGIIDIITKPFNFKAFSKKVSSII